jgi:hypothetical protein
MGTAFTPAKTSLASWDAFSDVNAFVDAVLSELAAMAADGTRLTRSGPKRGASSAAAKIYSNDALFGPVPVGFRVVRHLIAEYGVLTWRTSPYARHVFGPASILHAVNRPLIWEVAMACNTPEHGHPDWSSTDLIAVSIWRATR